MVVRAQPVAWRLSIMTSQKGPNIKKKQKCKNCEGKGLLKKGDKVVKCQRCGGTGLR
jgi:DnaJ-class molecular chaperone